MPNGVACTVSNCHFWGSNNQCKAEQIIIEIDAHSKRNMNNEFSDEFSLPQHKDVAKKSAETCCLTFKAKEKTDE